MFVSVDRKRHINKKGQNVLTLGPPKQGEEQEAERLQIDGLCRAFYIWLARNTSVPELIIFPEAHYITINGKAGFGAFNVTENKIYVALRGLHECAGSYEEAVELSLETVAHEFHHFTQGHTQQIDAQEREVERYARSIVRKYLILIKKRGKHGKRFAS